MTRQTVLLCAVLLVPVSVTGQTGAWEIGVHAGGAFSDALGGGTGSVPGPSSPFTTVAGRPSRRVSSWFFGDGAELLNGTAAALGLSNRITSLDAVVTNPFAERQDGGSFGVRVSRDITSRVAAEVSVDVVSSRPEKRAVGSACQFLFR